MTTEEPGGGTPYTHAYYGSPDWARHPLSQYHCYACDAAANTFRNRIAPNTCKIDGKCYNPGDMRPGDRCRFCDPSRSQTSWTIREASSGWCKMPDPGMPTGYRCVPNNEPQVPEVPCVKCMTHLSTSKYTHDPATCRIDGVCYDNGDLRTVNDAPWPCESCQSYRDQLAWSTTLTQWMPVRRPGK